MRRVAVLVLVVGAAAVGCGDDSTPGAGGGEDSVPDATLLEGDQVEISAIDNSFQPEAGRIAAGTEVTFDNDGRNDHNVIPVDDSFDFTIDTPDFAPGDSGSFTFSDPGVYRYYCSIHGTADAGMTGVIVVE